MLMEYVILSLLGAASGGFAFYQLVLKVNRKKTSRVVNSLDHLDAFTSFKSPFDLSSYQLKLIRKKIQNRRVESKVLLTELEQSNSKVVRSEVKDLALLKTEHKALKERFEELQIERLKLIDDIDQVDDMMGKFIDNRSYAIECSETIELNNSSINESKARDLDVKNEISQLDNVKQQKGVLENQITELLITYKSKIEELRKKNSYINISSKVENVVARFKGIVGYNKPNLQFAENLFYLKHKSNNLFLMAFVLLAVLIEVLFSVMGTHTYLPNLLWFDLVEAQDMELIPVKIANLVLQAAFLSIVMFYCVEAMSKINKRYIFHFKVDTSKEDKRVSNYKWLLFSPLIVPLVILFGLALLRLLAWGDGKPDISEADPYGTELTGTKFYVQIAVSIVVALLIPAYSTYKQAKDSYDNQQKLIGQRLLDFCKGRTKVEEKAGIFGISARDVLLNFVPIIACFAILIYIFILKK